ncbi:MAG: ATP-binding protein [Chloroflexota bacterium]
MEEYLFRSLNRLPSEKDSINIIIPLLKDLRETVGLREDQYFNLLVAVTEAVNNAIVHGNRMRGDKSVDLIISANDTEVRIEVCDQGEGFNPEDIADCLHPDNILKDSGRGIFLIRSLVDQVCFKPTKNGTKILMIIYYKNIQEV